VQKDHCQLGVWGGNTICKTNYKKHRNTISTTLAATQWQWINRRSITIIGAKGKLQRKRFS